MEDVFIVTGDFNIDLTLFLYTSTSQKLQEKTEH